MTTGTAWTPDEVELIVADYFAMLRAELSGRQINKTEHNRRLQARLRGRSRGSIEFKHANITAVLLNLGDFPTIDGYKPRWNYQRHLEAAILQWLDGEPSKTRRSGARSPGRTAPTWRPSSYTIA